MEWFLWALVAYYGINLAVLPHITNKNYQISSGGAFVQAIIWLVIIVELPAILL